MATLCARQLDPFPLTADVIPSISDASSPILNGFLPFGRSLRADLEAHSSDRLFQPTKVYSFELSRRCSALNSFVLISSISDAPRLMQTITDGDLEALISYEVFQP